MIVDGPNSARYPLDVNSCWTENVHFGGVAGCNASPSAEFWAWNEIKSPRGKTPAKAVADCAGNHPAAKGVLFYAGDSSLAGPWSAAWKVPRGTRTTFRLLELYGCQRGQVSCVGNSHFDVVTLRPRNLLTLWKKKHSSSFGPIVNIGGSNVGDPKVGDYVLAACRATRVGAFGVYWGSSERANLTNKRLHEVTAALNTCLSSGA